MKYYKVYRQVLQLVICCLILTGLTGHALAASTVNLGNADSFSVLAGTGVSNVPTSNIHGDVGLSPASGSNYAGLTALEVTGTIYAVDGFGPAGSVNNPALLTSAKNDLTAAYIDAAGRTPTTTLVSSDNQLGGQTFNPGVYRFGHASSANLTAALPLTLDAQGDPSAVFIFQASSDLVTASSSVIQLVNGAQACNIFWQVTSSAALGTNSTFKGSILALTADTVTTGTNVEGRVLARNAAVSLNASTITRPTCAVVTTPASSTPASGNSTSTSTPRLPNTGFGPGSDHTAALFIVISAGITLVSVLIYGTRKKHILNITTKR